MQPTKNYCGNNRHRMSSDKVWPLRGSDGLTFAERKALKETTDGMEQANGR